MWTQEVIGTGTDIYHVIAAFLIYSILGWIVESIYMSFCNRKLTNRGFAKGPFCPIYGFGGVLGYIILHPLSGQIIALYLVGAIVATTFEFLVGNLMIRLFGELWWDYNNKPFNYKGIICAESTIAWGFYAVIIILFLNGKIMEFIDRYSYDLGTKICSVVLLICFTDFTFSLLHTIGRQPGRWCVDMIRKTVRYVAGRF